jgi:asparagine synthase (glutamine-hydrolysing)
MMEGYEFLTDSDTVIVLYSNLKEQALKKLRGMFVFAI